MSPPLGHFAADQPFGGPNSPDHPGVADLGRYRLIRHLATGGMGEVYLAESVGAAGFAKRVVVKVLRSDLASDAALVRQLVAEGRLLEALDHPNIAQILDIGQAGEVFWLAMEYVDGWDLRAVLRVLPAADGRGHLSENAVLHVVASVARALAHAQTRRGPDGRPLAIVHHDVSPSNVMVRSDGHVKLVDFGVARAALLGRLSAGALRGKLPYLSPEHAAAQPVDGRADLFALGLVAYELLTGERALDVVEARQLDRAYQRLPARLAVLQDKVKSGLWNLLTELLALQPAGRPTDAATVAEVAERLLVEAAESSPARRLAEEMAPAFARLEAKSASFDKTLQGILGLADRAGQPEMTGTLSLPGLDVVAVAAASARDQLPGSSRPRKRWITAGLLVVVAAIAGGFWMGRRTPTPLVAQPVGGVAVAAGPRPQSVAGPRPQSAAGPRPQSAAATDPRASAVAPALDIAAVAAVVPAAAALSTPVTSPVVERQGPSQGGATAVKADDTGDERPKSKKVEASKNALLRFRVQPFSCEVSVDGARQRPVADSDRYEVSVSAGDHRIRVRDPASGQQKELWVRKVRENETRVLTGGICLGDGCPSG